MHMLDVPKSLSALEVPLTATWTFQMSMSDVTLFDQLISASKAVLLKSCEQSCERKLQPQRLIC